MPVVYGDVHCIIGDGDVHSGSCQTFSPNCAVKLPMSPSIRGKPVHVFAEDYLIILSYYHNLQQGITSFPGPFFILIFRNVYQAFEHGLVNIDRNLYIIQYQLNLRSS